MGDDFGPPMDVTEKSRHLRPSHTATSTPSYRTWSIDDFLHTLSSAENIVFCVKKTSLILR